MRLHESLQRTDRVAVTSVFGMGGVGKTELVLQYARQYFLERGDYPGGVCCVSARAGDLGAQLLSFGRVKLGLEPPEDLADLAQQVQWVWTRWRPEQGNVLVVLDDVVAYETIQPFLPPEDLRFKVVLTTRSQTLSPNFTPLELQVLSREAAIALLRALVGKERIDAELAAADALCEDLGDLPLGLELVGQYLDEAADLSVAEMLAELREEKLAHPGMAEPTAATTANQGVRAAFELSWRRLSVTAQELGCLVSVFALAPVPWELVENSIQLTPKPGILTQVKYRLKGKKCLSKFSDQELRQVRDRELVKRSLLIREEKGTYRLHQLVREFLQEKLALLTDSDELKRCVGKAIAKTTRRMPQTPTLKDIAKFTLFIPHWEETTEQLTPYLEDEDLIWPFTALDWFYEGQGLYAVARPWLEGGFEATCQRFGKAHSDVAATLNNLALLNYAQGQYEQAEYLFLQALEIVRKVLEEDHPDVAMTLKNLADLYLEQGKYGQAESLCFQALEIFRKVLGEEHPDVATALNSLALVHHRQGKYEQAEPLYLQARSLYQKALGEGHPNVALSLNNLAELYREQGKYEQAEPLYLQTQSLYQKALGEGHPNVALSLNNLASLNYAQGKHGQAELLYLQALDIRKKALGEEHPDVVLILNNLADLYRKQGKYEEAEPLFLQALMIFSQGLGESHPKTQVVQRNYECCITQAHQSGLAHTLSDHPLTQQTLEQIQHS